MTTEPTPDRRERYAAAIRAAGDTAYGNHPFYEAITDAVIALADAEHAELRKRHWDGLRRADEINNNLMEEVQRYAEGTERPVLWSVYNQMHKRALAAEAEAERLRAAATPPTDWIDRHPQLEAIAAAVWEQCGRSDSGMCVEDDPRNIAVAALAAVLPPSVSRADQAPAAECSAQNRNYESGPRLCIRVAQHHGDHIDERGFHWSDTVAVYPLADGTFRTGVNRAVLRRMADEAQPDTQAKVDRLTALTAPALLATIKELRDLHAPLTEALTTVYQSMKSCVGDEWAMEWLGEVWTQIPLTVRAAAGDQDAADELAAGAQQDGARR